ncbi:MAG: hypothetical protein V2A76_11595 [Planctomycetota bacterium]
MGASILFRIGCCLVLVSSAPADQARLLGPRVGPEREAALRKYGGGPETEKGVLAGLDWLARHQEPDGTWDADQFPSRCEEGGDLCDGIGKGQHGEAVPCPFDTPMTALVALAFLGHSHPPDRGFGDAAPFREGSDVPYTALCVQALLAAREAGFELPDDLAPGVDRFFSSLENRGGRLAYLLEGRKYGYTPTATNAHLAAATRLLLQVGLAGSQHRSYMTLLGKSRPQWQISFKTLEIPGQGTREVHVGSLSMYQWWYGTIAAFHKGGATWTNWYAATNKTLLEHQRKQGCARESWDPLGTYERQTGGRVFATALGVLMLEQPYRQRRL